MKQKVKITYPYVAYLIHEVEMDLDNDFCLDDNKQELIEAIVAQEKLPEPLLLRNALDVDFATVFVENV